MKKNIIAGQSGGPTAVINASLYGVIEEGISRAGELGTIYGMINGIEGFLSGHFMDLSASLSPEDRELLKHTPGAYLGSCRHKLPQNMDSPVYPLLFEKLESMDIGALFYIGGNDSMDTVEKLSRYGDSVIPPFPLSASPRPLTTICPSPTTHPATEAQPNTLPPRSGRSFWTPPCTSSHPSPLWS